MQHKDTISIVTDIPMTLATVNCVIIFPSIILLLASLQTLLLYDINAELCNVEIKLQYFHHICTLCVAIISDTRTTVHSSQCF